jgi:hypothetical protein
LRSRASRESEAEFVSLSGLAQKPTVYPLILSTSGKISGYISTFERNRPKVLDQCIRRLLIARLCRKDRRFETSRVPIRAAGSQTDGTLAK